MRQTRSQTRTKSVADTNGNSTKSLEYTELKVSFCYNLSDNFVIIVSFIASCLHRLEEEYF